MAMQKKLWSINGLANELEIDRRTLAKRLEGLPPATVKKMGNRTEKRWRLANVLEHFKNPRARPAFDPVDEMKEIVSNLKNDEKSISTVKAITDKSNKPTVTEQSCFDF